MLNKLLLQIVELQFLITNRRFSLFSGLVLVSVESQLTGTLARETGQWGWWPIARPRQTCMHVYLSEYIGLYWLSVFVTAGRGASKASAQAASAAAAATAASVHLCVLTSRISCAVGPATKHSD